MKAKQNRHAVWRDLGLPGNIQKSLLRRGFHQPTPIQRKAIPGVLIGRNLFAVAPAGTGKTLAYLLPVWTRLAHSSTRALILAPTRELCFQISQVLRSLSPELYDRSAVAVGGQRKETQERKLRGKWNIAIATPGRLIDFLEQDSAMLENVSILVMDEFDKLLKLGFKQQISLINSRLPKSVQTLWFSATEPEEKPDNVPDKTLSIRLDSPIPGRYCEEIIYYLKSSRKKTGLCLEELNRETGQTIVFVSNREKAKHLHGYLALKNHPCKMLHGKMNQKQRSDVYQAFMQQKVPVLIATDIAARGLDTLNLDLVINFNLPRSAVDYLHRKGRVGRLDRPGRCISYAGPEEYIPMKNLVQGLGYSIPSRPGYGNRETWLLNARARHRKKVRAEARTKEIKRNQGL